MTWLITYMNQGANMLNVDNEGIIQRLGNGKKKK